MRRFLLTAVVGCVAGLAAGPAWTQCLDMVAHVTHDITGQPPEMGSATAVAVSEGYAYYNVGPVLHVVDVTVPSDPRVMGELTLGGSIRAVAVDGSMAYVAMGSAGLSVVDISDPWAPEEVLFIDSAGDSEDLAVSGGYLYLAAGWAGLVVFDLHDPTEPVEVGGFRGSGLTRAVAVAHAESCTYAFLANSAGLIVVDVTDPRRPFEVGRYSLSPAYDVVVSGGYAFVYQAHPAHPSLHVIDASTPSALVDVGEVGYFTLPGFRPPSLAVSSSRVYVGGFPRLAVVDLNPPWVPVVNCELLWDYPTGRIVWAGGYLYVPIVDVWAQRAGLKILREGDVDPADFGSIECIGPPLGYLSFAE